MLRCEVTFPGLDMEEQPVPVCRRVFDNAVLRIIFFPAASSSTAECFHFFLDISAGLGNLFSLPYCASCICAAGNLINAWSEQLALLLEPK